jgi:hypothetical protein
VGYSTTQKAHKYSDHVSNDNSHHSSDNKRGIYTEALNSEQLMLVITSLTETMAGEYFCFATYATDELLENKVTIEAYGEE